MDPACDTSPGLAEAFRRIADISGQAVVVTRPAAGDARSQRIVYANPAFRRLTGFGPEDLVGRPAEILFGPKTEGARLKQIRAALGAGRATRARLVVYRKDGGEQPVDVSLEPAAGADGTRHWVQVHQPVPADGAARRSPAGHAALTMISEHQGDLAWLLGEALDNLSIGFGLYGPDRRLILCNRQQRRFFSPIADLLVPGTPLEDIVATVAERDVVKGARERADTWIEEWLRRFRNPDGPFEVQLTEGRWLQGELHKTVDGGAVGIWSDVTDLKDKEQALRHRVLELQETQGRLEHQGERLAELAENLAAARDEALRANRTKSEFLANMSHELRSPLNAIIGFAEIMKDELFGPLGLPQYREYADDIFASGSHLLEVINDILDLSKIEAGRLELHEESTDVRAAVAACTRLVYARAQEAGVRLVTKIAPQLPRAFVDERKFKQILLNLLSNAIKFTDEGGRVTTAARIDARGRLVVTVSDTGIGIPADRIETAMSAFGQVDSSLSRRYEGTGLGLPLTKALVELHDGRFELKSKEGAGTKAIVTLPARRVLARRPAAAARRAKPDPRAAVRIGPVR